MWNREENNRFDTKCHIFMLRFLHLAFIAEIEFYPRGSTKLIMYRRDLLLRFLTCLSHFHISWALNEPIYSRLHIRGSHLHIEQKFIKSTANIHVPTSNFRFLVESLIFLLDCKRAICFKVTTPTPQRVIYFFCHLKV